MSVTLKSSEKMGHFFMVRANLDSSEIRGQGKFIWEFLKKQLSLLAKEKGKNVLHEVSPNEYSLHLVKKDWKYKKKGNLYYGLYQ